MATLDQPAVQPNEEVKPIEQPAIAIHATTAVQSVPAETDQAAVQENQADKPGLVHTVSSVIRELKEKHQSKKRVRSCMLLCKRRY